MKRLLITYLIIFLIPIFLFGQKQVAQKDTVAFYRHSFSVEAGTHYNYFPGDGYIPPPVKAPAIDPDYSQSGLTKKSVLAVHYGILYTYHINKSITITSGLSYYNRKRVLLRNAATDTIDTSLYYVSPILKERIYSNSIDIPLFIGYSVKRFSALIGAKLNLFNIRHTYSKTIDKEVAYFNKIKGGVRKYKWFYPEARLNYTIINGKIPVSIYIAVNVDNMGLHFYDFLAGFQVLFMNKNKKVQ